jgi:hypothetical protein
MPNHARLIATPAHENGLRSTFADAHRRYTGAINARFRWTGHLFEGRFGAMVMDEPHLLAAARYIALNPVTAGLVRRAEDWPWSSARAQLAGEDDELVTVAPLRAQVPDFTVVLAAPGRPRGNGSVRAGTDDRTTARGTGTDRGAGAAARPPAGARQTRPEAANGPCRRSASAVGVTRSSKIVNCHCNPLNCARVNIVAASDVTERFVPVARLDRLTPLSLLHTAGRAEYGPFAIFQYLAPSCYMCTIVRCMMDSFFFIITGKHRHY